MNHSLYATQPAMVTVIKRPKRVTLNIPRFICFISSIILLIIMAYAWIMHADADELQRIKTLSHYETVTVNFGDTLLGIAEQYSPDENVRGFMWEIMQHNDLDDTKIYRNQQLSIPVYTVQQIDSKTVK